MIDLLGGTWSDTEKTLFIAVLLEGSCILCLWLRLTAAPVVELLTVHTTYGLTKRNNNASSQCPGLISTVRVLNRKVDIPNIPGRTEQRNLKATNHNSN